MIDNRVRLKDDFEFYARNCLSIRTKEDGLKPFILNNSQKYIHAKLEEQVAKTGKVRAIILKGRQMGCSTYVEGRYIWRATHKKGVRAFILTHDGESTNALFEMTERFYDNLPAPVKPSCGASNAKELHFDLLDSGYKIGTAGNKSVGRGQTIQYFHGSECGFWDNASELTKGVFQAVPNGGGSEIILESTANGIGNFFHKQWKLAEKGLSEFIPIFIPWYWQAEYRREPPKDLPLTDEEAELQRIYKLDKAQMYWRRLKIAELTTDASNGDKAFKQEYPMTAAEAFQVTGADGLINADHCMKARAEECQTSGAFIVGVDPSRGGDRFAIVRRQGRKMWGLDAYVGEECNALGKNVAICKRILDTEDPVSKKTPDMMFIDYGAGADIVDRLHELGYKKRVKSVHFGSTPFNKERYKNKRNEIWGDMALWLTDETLPADIPDNDELQADLCASPFNRDSNDRQVLWAKEKIKAEYGFSPDYGDAAALTFTEPVSLNKTKKKMSFAGSF